MWIFTTSQIQTNVNLIRLKCGTLFMGTLLVLAFFSQNADADRIYTAMQGDSEPSDTQSKENSKGVGTIPQLDNSIKSDKRLTAHNIASDPQFCVQYDSLTKSITITCNFANLSQIDKVLKNPKVLKKDGQGAWLLNANLTIANDANFIIDSNDTKWLKINSTTGRDAHHIYVKGNMKIDSVKISSWNTSSNDYAKTDLKTPRASIIIQPKGTGKTDIFNSEIAYLGDGNTSRGQGLSYWSGNGSVLRNNTIHHLYYGFYSERIGNITIENNTVHSDIKYGLDPHTLTHDMIIRNNNVHSNGHIGIICSLDCKNITIEGNTVYNNTKAGIMLSKNVQDSIVRDNQIQGENTGISVSESSKDAVHGNVIRNSTNGIQVKLNSSNNIIQNNSIYYSDKCGIQVSDKSSTNMIISNSILNPAKSAICLLEGPTTNAIKNNTLDASGSYALYARNSPSKDNIVKENVLLNVTGTPIKMVNSTLTVINNTSPIR
jgi:poly(beta-D-mannuronate) C5 epimerase